MYDRCAPALERSWVEIEHHGFDEFGFAALPGGARWLEGNFSLLGARGFWWSSTEACSMGSLARYMDRLKGSVQSISLTKSGGMSIRCIR